MSLVMTPKSGSLSKESYLPVYNTWKQLSNALEAGIKTGFYSPMNVAYPMTEALVINETFDESQKSIANFLHLKVISPDPAGTYLKQKWLDMMPYIQLGLAGSARILNSLSAGNSAQLTTTSALKVVSGRSILSSSPASSSVPADSTPKAADTTPAPVEEGMPSWVIPAAAVVGVVALGGLYWYMNRGA